MLNVLRENFKEGPFLKWILILVAVSLVAYLGNFFLGGGGTASTWAARVNGEQISTRRFVDAARTLDNYYRQLFGTNFEQLRPQLQIARQALDQLIEQEVIKQDAARLGLQTRKEEVAQQIRTHPGLQTATGVYVGDERTKELLQRSYAGGLEGFVRTVEDDLLAEKWTNLVTRAVHVADAELEREFRQRTVKTEIDFLLLEPDEDIAGEEVDDAAARLWYDEHREDYRRDDARRVRLLIIDREAQRSEVVVSDEGIQTYYDDNRDNYTTPEQRRARHVLRRTDPGMSDEDKQALREEAVEILGRLQAGEDFETLAGELSQDPASAERGGDLGFFGRGAMVPSFENAVFETPVGEFAPITKTNFGFHVIQVTGSREAGLRPLDEVRDSIVNVLELRAAQERVETEAQRIREAMDSAERFDEVAAAEGLEIDSRLFVKGERLPDLGASPDLLLTLSTLDMGQISPPQRLAAGMALAVVDEVLPAAVPPFEEVRDRVVADAALARALDAALAKAEQALTRHETLAAVAEALDVTVQSSGEVAPGQPIRALGRPTPEFDRLIFDETADPGDRGTIALDPGAVIYEITSRTAFDPLRFETEKAALREELLRERRVQYRKSLVQELVTEQEIEINAALVEQVSG